MMIVLEITTLHKCCSIYTSGHRKFLLEVLSIFHYGWACYSACWSGRQGGRFTPQNYQPHQHTHSLSSFSSLNPSVEDNPHHTPRDKHKSTQIQAKHFKAMQGSCIHSTQYEPQTAWKQERRPDAVSRFPIMQAQGTT